MTKLRQDSSRNDARSRRKLGYVVRALTTLSAVNRILIRANDETALLHDVCSAVVDRAGYRMAWVGYAEHDERKSIRPMAHWGFEAGFLDADKLQRAGLSWAEDEQGQHGLGVAIRGGQICVAQDILSDPLFPAGAREAAHRRGYASVIALPLRVADAILGVLVIYAPEIDAFDAREVELLTETADDLAFGIETLRMRERHRQAEEALRRMAHYDPLTDLPNRVRMAMHLEEEIALARQQNRPLALLLIGMRRFREINETLGYRQGDALLREVASRLVEQIGEAQRVARVGEAEFAVLLPAVNAAAAIEMGRRLLAALHAPLMLAGLCTNQRASIGIALFPGHGTEAEILIRRANLAMQQARQSPGALTLYSGGLDEECLRRLTVISDLHRAIDADELALYCQPKVHLGSGRVCGAEALVRWEHPQRGPIGPDQFIGLAERSGLISRLTDWVLQAALRQIHAWHEAGIALPLAVNLSANDLQDERFLERIDCMFVTWGEPHAAVQFELTESALMQDPRTSLERLTGLRERGCRLYIDDFGTGYSSLAYLRELPIDAIKIDKSFVTDMLENPGSEAIVRSTIDLAHHLGLEVVAEGVEDRQVLDQLAGAGCDVVQGHLICTPTPALGLDAWLAGSPWPLPAERLQ